MKAIVIVILTMISASACEVPVFRFALERWASEPLTLQVAADGPGGPDGEAALRRLRNQVPDQVASNIKVQFVEPVHSGDKRVLMRLLPHASAGPDAPPWWEGMMTEDNARDLTSCPLREKIADEILDGTSAVWLIISQGDPDSDARAMAIVQKGIDRAMQQLTLPKGVIEPQDAARKMAMFPSATMDDVLRTTLPLRIRFKAELLRHDDVREVILRDLLGRVASACPPGEALVAPVFGRGRVLAPAPASTVGEDGVFQGCAYLCGACACMVKQQNPGYDLPMRVDWNRRLKPHVAVIDHATPPNRLEIVEYGKPPATKDLNPQSPPQPIIRTTWIAAAAISLLLIAIWLGIVKRRHP